ncbi:MAG: Rossmann-like and DUF2520 domain-containing protein [Longimonas sp.]|uniref:Rossmann-like and DUF2520 domain-containing protein n=1 Tax=Longimonas sp. TaxID=2039626 RepID=UPI0039751C3A
MSHRVREPTAIVGAGAVGQALAQALSARHVPLTAIISRTQTDATALAERVQADRASTSLAALPQRTTRVLFCVPDTHLAEVAHALAQSPHRTAPWIAMHPSGAHPAHVLAPLRACGAALLSAHPLQTFTSSTPPSAFHGIRMTIEGDAAALDYGEALADLLGATPQRLSSAAKPLYHLAAVLASNGLVALLVLAQRVWAAADLNPDDAFAALAPLIETTWANVQRDGPAALTGPAARGDADTVATHLHALQHTVSDLPLTDDVAEPLYAALTETMLRIQEHQNALSATEADRVRARMHQARAPSPSENDSSENDSSST